MEQHPVPKNVLNVEFKLFGSLTVKQFLKVLVGCMLALVIFSIDMNVIIKLPLIIASLVIGVFSALVPGFETKFMALLRAVFVSPQYVWRKSTKVPEVLAEPEIKPEDKKVETKTTASQSASDMSIDQILATRAVMEGSRDQQAVVQQQQAATTTVTPPTNTVPAVDPNNPAAHIENNFDRIYADVYGVKSMDASLESRRNQPANQPVVSSTNNLASQSTATGQKIALGPNTQMNVQPLQNSAPRPISNIPKPSQINGENLLAAYQEELQKLQAQLKDLTRQGADDAQKQQVMQRINEVYNAIKQSGMLPKVPVAAPRATPMENQNARLIYGLVVDKKDVPIPDVEINILNSESKVLIKDVHTKEDGSFAIEAPLPAGEYVVDLHSSQHKFYQFKIVINDAKLPAFKFREK